MKKSLDRLAMSIQKNKKSIMYLPNAFFHNIVVSNLISKTVLFSKSKHNCLLLAKLIITDNFNFWLLNHKVQ